MNANASSTGGGEEAAPHKKPATLVASSTSYQIETILEQSRLREESILKKARTVDLTGDANDAAWNDLLPDLNEEWRLRSQQGDLRKLGKLAGLEPYTRWLMRFIEVKKLRISVRTAQRNLKKWRGGSPAPKRARQYGLPVATQKRFILAGILAHDLAETASETGEDGLSAVARAFKAAAPSRDEMEQSLDQFSAVEPATAGERASVPMEEGNATREQRVIKRGNISDLNAEIEESNGAQITICFDGLDGNGVAHAAEMIVNGVLQRHGHVARGDGEYQVSVTYIPAKPRFRRKWKPKSESVN